MKKNLLIAALLFVACAVNAQRALEWYSYWGSFEAGNQIEPVKMAIANDGNIYVAAMFGGEKVNVESTTLKSLSSVDKGDAVIVKMSPSKQVVWTYPIVSSGTAKIADITINKAGEIIVTGIFTGAIRVNNDEMAFNDEYMGEEGIYILKLSEAGQAIKAWQIAAIGAKANSVVVDSKDNIIVSGILDGDAWFGGDAAEGDFQNVGQMFVAKYDKDGNLLWKNFKQDADAVSLFTNAYADVDKEDNIYIGGTLTGATEFCGKTVSTDYSNMFIVKLNAAGQDQWVHTINGSRADYITDVTVSPIGEVAILGSHYSEDMKIDGDGDVFNNGFAKDGDANQYHSAIFAFDQASGDYKWWYDFGYNSTVGGGGAYSQSLYCSTEGVWYFCGSMSGRLGDSHTNEDFSGNANSGTRAIDGQWIQHNTNGGEDCYVVTLTREGRMANILRPGGIQTERAMDVALSPDKKSLYMLIRMQVRDNLPYTCAENLFDSFTDLYKNANLPDRSSKYELIPVFCPEYNGAAEKYTKAYKNAFASAMLCKYAFPALNVYELPYLVKGQDYEQAVSLVDPKGDKSYIFKIEEPEGFLYEEGKLTGKTDTADAGSFGFLAVDSIPLPEGGITYYAQDAGHESVRSNPRVLRYMALTDGTTQENPDDAVINVKSNINARVYPTLCESVLFVECEESNYTFSIYTTDGRMLFTEDNVTAVGAGQLPAGFYLVEIRTATGRNLTKIQVK